MVIKDWHVVEGRTPSRQKVVEITVGEAYPGKDYRVRVQFVVPANKKAKGFSLSAGVSDNDISVGGCDGELIEAGVGLVKTHINNLPGGLKRPRDERFYKTLDPRYRNFWIWPATYMRAITAAYAEKDHFEKGKVLVSGFSKVGENRIRKTKAKRRRLARRSGRPQHETGRSCSRKDPGRSSEVCQQPGRSTVHLQKCRQAQGQKRRISVPAGNSGHTRYEEIS